MFDFFLNMHWPYIFCFLKLLTNHGTWANVCYPIKCFPSSSSIKMFWLTSYFCLFTWFLIFLCALLIFFHISSIYCRLFHYNFLHLSVGLVLFPTAMPFFFKRSASIPVLFPLLCSFNTFFRGLLGSLISLFQHLLRLFFPFHRFCCISSSI